MTALAFTVAEEFKGYLMNFEAFRYQGIWPAWAPNLLAAMSVLTLVVERFELLFTNQYWYLRQFSMELHGQFIHMLGCTDELRRPWVRQYQVLETMVEAATHEEEHVKSDLSRLLRHIKGWYRHQPDPVRLRLLRQLDCLVTALDLATDVSGINILTKSMKSITEVYHHLLSTEPMPPSTPEPAEIEG